MLKMRRQMVSSPLNTVRWMGQILLCLAHVFRFINSKHHLLNY